MRAHVVVRLVALLCAWPTAAMALGAERSCSDCLAPRAAETLHALTIERARSASRNGDWNRAAELWRDALVLDDRNAEHWIALGDVLSRAERHREAVGAYQRAIQLDARFTRTGTRSVARAFARMGNDRQAVRWLEQTLRLGVSAADVWEEELFARYRHDPRLRVVQKRQVDQRGPRTQGWGRA